MTFLNFWNVNGGLTRRFQTFDDLDTRGGPPIYNPAGVNYYFNGGSDSRKSWRITFGGNGGRDSKGGHDRAFVTNLSVQPSGRLQLSLAARHEKGLNIAQWIEKQRHYRRRRGRPRLRHAAAPGHRARIPSTSNPRSSIPIRTSIDDRCAETSCSAGNTSAAARSFWCGTCRTKTARRNTC